MRLFTSNLSVCISGGSNKRLIASMRMAEAMTQRKRPLMKPERTCDEKDFVGNINETSSHLNTSVTMRKLSAGRPTGHNGRNKTHDKGKAVEEHMKGI